MSDCINGRKGCDTHGLHYHSPRLEITYSENEVTEKFAALRAENAKLREALRHAARELQYVLDADPCEQGVTHQSGEGLACIVLAESLLGPMRDWPEEPNASARAAASPSAPDGGGGER